MKWVRTFSPATVKKAIHLAQNFEEVLTGKESHNRYRGQVGGKDEVFHPFGATLQHQMARSSRYVRCSQNGFKR